MLDPDPSPSTSISSSDRRSLTPDIPRVEPSGGLSTHILPTSATMVGVCMTVLTIGHIGPAGEMRWLIDKLLALDALLFLASAVLSFLSLRTGLRVMRQELRAEWVFIIALTVLSLAALVLAFAIT